MITEVIKLFGTWKFKKFVRYNRELVMNLMVIIYFNCSEAGKLLFVL